MKILGAYQNGNYSVVVFEDGSKIRHTSEDYYLPNFPENIDLKITNRCNLGCPMCHENSCPTGKNADLLSLSFLNTLRPYTEVAIGGGNIFENPQLYPFLLFLKERKIFANITINQAHFEENYNLVKHLIQRKMVNGVGVSLDTPSHELVAKLKSCGENVVLHVINGIVKIKDIEEFLIDQNLKMLILGYKAFGRGTDFVKKNLYDVVDNQTGLYDALPELIGGFKVVSFDNLAIEQLNCKRLFLNKKEYNQFYMGDEGEFTMYVDAVKREFGRNSIAEDRLPIEEDIDKMFLKVYHNRNIN